MKTFCKLKLIILSLLAVMILPSVAAIIGGYAVSVSFNPPSGVPSYYYFDTPSAIACDSDTLYIADGSEVVKFSVDTFNKKSSFFTSGNAISSIAAWEGTFYSVENGDVYRYSAPDFTANKILTPNYIPYNEVKVSQNYIYVSDLYNVYVYNRTSLALEGTLFGQHPINCFAADDNGAYIFTEASNPLKTAVYYQSLSTFAELAANAIDPVLAADINAGVLTVLGRTKVRTYTKGLVAITESDNAFAPEYTAFSATNGIYFITPDKSVLKAVGDFGEYTEVIVSASSAAGFFDNPVDITTRLAKVFVADKNNSRLAIFEDNNYLYLDNLPAVSAITAAAFDSVYPQNGEIIYVAYSENKIAALDSSLNRLSNPSDEVIRLIDGEALPQRSDEIIKDIKIDALNNLYLLTNSQRLYVRNDDGVFEFLQSGISLIDTSAEQGFAIVLQGNDVKKLELGDIAVFTTLASTSNVIDIALDADGSFYALFADFSISRFEKSNAYSLSATVFADAKTDKIAVSNVHSDFVAYRDLLLLSSIKNNLKVITCDEFGISYPDPALRESADKMGAFLFDESERIIRTISHQSGTKLFAQESEVSTIAVLPYGYKVIVPSFTPSKVFTRVICDPLDMAADSSLLVGYINTRHLSQALAYTDRYEDEGKVWLPSASLYVLPSLSAPVPEDFGTLSKDDSLVFASFAYEMVDNKIVYGYLDNTEAKNKWYRVRVPFEGNDYSLYIPSSAVSIQGANPDTNLRPQYNAIIIAKKDDSLAGAYIYTYDEQSDEYKVNPNYDILSVGTKVEVVGIFDSSKPFHKVLFYTDYGIAEGYIETASLQYLGVNLVQVIAIVLIILAVVLLITASLHAAKVRRERTGIS